MSDVINTLIDGDFFLMFIPKTDVFGKDDIYKLKYSFGEFVDADAYMVYSENSACDTGFYSEYIETDRLVVFENSLGSFIFADPSTSEVFQILQRKHKDTRNFVFFGVGTFGYFKILENGKIRRKIASFGNVHGISHYPESRGEMCEYEADTEKLYKIDPKAHLLVDMMPDFGHTQVADILDYYLGRKKIRNSTTTSVRIYELRNR